MIPYQLSLLNFMCYRAELPGGEPLTLSLDGVHVACLSGENGAGKSALLDAITWALWGEARTADDDLIAQGAAEMLVELEFELGAQRYRVARRRQRGGTTGKRGGTAAGKTALDLQVRNEAGWRPIGENTVRETQEQIDKLLRMSYQTFINASFLLQGRADEFTSRTPAERKQVLADILDLGEYAVLEGRARERARDLDGRIKGLAGQIEALEEQAGKVPLWQSLVADAERGVTALTEQLQAAEGRQAEADQRMDALKLQAEQRKGLLRRIEELRAEQAARENEIADLRIRIAADEQLIGRRAEIAAGVAALAAARADVARLDGLREQHHALLGRRRELQGELKTVLQGIKGELSQAERQADMLRTGAARRAPLAEEIAAIEQRIAELRPVAAELEARRQERQEAEALLGKLAALRLRRSELVALIEKRQDSLVAVREEQTRTATRIEAQLRDEAAWQAELQIAQAAAQRLADAEIRLAGMRRAAQEAAERVGALRAECKRLKAEGERLKEHKTLLDSGGGSCPICRSELGVAGLEHVHGFYDGELDTMRRGYAEAKRQADEGEAAQRELTRQIAALEGEIATLGRKAAGVDTLTARLADAARWREELAAITAQLADLKRQIEQKAFEPAAQAELIVVESEVAGLGDRAELEQRRAILDERLRELEGRLQERGRLEGTLGPRREELARAEADAARLPEAEAEAAALARRIDAGDYAHDIRAEGREVESQIAALGYGEEGHTAARELARDLARWEQEERGLMLAEQRHAADSRALAQAEELRAARAGEIERLTREDALLEEALRALPRAQAEADEARRLVEDQRRSLGVAQNDLSEKQAYLKRAEEDARRLEGLRVEERALRGRHGLFAELGEAFGKKGVQAMLIETAIPQIEDEANRLLGRMTDNQMHVSFEMQRDTKKGDTVETLEIKIADTLGTRAYDAFSGGEAMRANFAVRIALSRLLARRAGARLETLVIDEGFGALDALGRERMVEAITSVQGDFRRIIVITHIDELKDRFPAQIEVTKTPLGSRWELR